MLDQLFELAIRAGGGKAWALKNVIFALAVTLHESQLKYQWESPGESLDEMGDAFYCLRQQTNPSRVIRIPGYRTSGVLSAFLMRKVMRDPNGEQTWNLRQRREFMAAFRGMMRRRKPEAVNDLDPEIKVLWQELVRIVDLGDIRRVLRWLNLNKAMLAEIRRYVPEALAA